MANKVISEDLKRKALAYKDLNIEKYQMKLAELKTRREALRANAQSKKAIQALVQCDELVKDATKELTSVIAVSDEMFVKVVLERSLLLNVIRAFDSGKIEKTAAEVLPEERVKEIIAQREERKSSYKQMSIEELLDVVMENERLEIEIFRAKALKNKKNSGSQGSEPAFE